VMLAVRNLGAARVAPSHPSSPAIDLVHLARQTDGDAALETELLGMFDRQSAKLIARLEISDVACRTRADIAHRLRGSALAIGARRVARGAEAVEKAFESGDGDPEAELAELADAVREARAAISALNG